MENILEVFRDALNTGQIPASWQTTIFKMLPKSALAKFASNFRPIASLPLLYKIFPYLMLGRMEGTLEVSQPEEQHGSRKRRRIEEHLLTANLCLQTTLAANIPLWIISFDLSKAFDTVDWDAPWPALMQHGVSQHLVWILECIYYGQSGKTREHFVNSRELRIRGGVRQGPALSPKLFCAVLEIAMCTRCCTPFRHVVGPPAGMDWPRPWRKILHDWNVRASTFLGQAGLKPWSQTCLEQF